MDLEPKVKVSLNGNPAIDMTMNECIDIMSNKNNIPHSLHVDAIEWGYWHEAQKNIKS